MLRAKWLRLSLNGLSLILNLKGPTDGTPHTHDEYAYSPHSDNTPPQLNMLGNASHSNCKQHMKLLTFIILLRVIRK